MKENKSTIIFIIIIILLSGYIVYTRYIKEDFNYHQSKMILKIDDEIKFDYLEFILLNNGECYLKPINIEEIDKLNLKDNLKERLTKLYEDAEYFDIYLNDNKLKGYKINIADKIKKITKIDDNVIILKENGTIALFNYDEYYNLMYIDVIDNYNNYQDVLDIKDKEIIYLDGSKKEFQ